jgi:DNA-binding beta-propeller fold protein YncE
MKCNMELLAISGVIGVTLVLAFIWFINTSAFGSNEDGTNSTITNNNYTLIAKWGSKGTGDGQLMFPHSIAVDSLGNAYVTDTGNKRIQKFTSDGKFITKWGSEGKGDGQFMGLHDVAVDPSGKFVYTVELVNHRVQKFDSNGKFITSYGSKGTGDGQFKRPEDIVVDASGNVYVCDTRNSRIQVFAIVK